MAYFNKIKNNLFPIILSMIFAIISIVLVRNEVFFDDWYIESAADGLFGANNRGILVLGANYLITCIIFVLSLTGIRLSWIHVIMLVINVVSTYMVTYVVYKGIHNRIKYFICIIVMLVTVPFVSFYMQFTTTAAYCIAAGCVWIFFIKKKCFGRKKIIFGIFWVVLGSSLRFDAMYFSMSIIGVLGVVESVKIIIDNRKTKKIQEILYQCWCFLSPFIIAIVIACIFEFSQRVLMTKYYPGFADWNTIRAHVDDYQIPDYYENEQIYADMGISYNDYCLLKSWNNIDESFFTEELYEDILHAKEYDYANESKEKGILSLLIYSSGVIISNYFFVIVVLLFTYIMFFEGLFSKIAVISSILVTYLLVTYFCLTKRIIWRTEWPIFLVLILAIIIVLTCFNDYGRKKATVREVYIGTFILVIGSLFVSPYSIEREEWSLYNGKSLSEVYFDRILSEDTYGKYIINKIAGNDNYTYATIDSELMGFTKLNKDILYYHLFMTSWLQPNPLTNKDLFRAEDVGAADNWATLGQYICRFNTEKKIEENYNIVDRFKDLINDNVRVTVQNWELRYRTEELNNYLRQHYYEQVDFSVTETLKNVAIGRFIKNYDTENISSDTYDVEIDINYDSGYDRMIKLTMVNFPLEIYHSKVKNIFVKLESQNGEKHTFAVMKNNSNEFYSIIYDDALTNGEKYNVSLITEGNDELVSYPIVKEFVFR